MSEESTELSFDRAVYADDQSAAPCGSCGQRLELQYWTCQGKLLCERCRVDTERTLGARKASFMRALWRGGLTALGCGIAYALFVHFTEIQIALATIGIAFVIARVLNNASSGVGGRRFQLLAVALTYWASTMGYFPAVLGAMSGDATEEAAEAAADPKHVPEPSTAVEPVKPPANAPAQAATKQGAAATNEEPPSGIAILVGLVLIFAITMAAPILSVTEAPIGFFIVLFGLWEAWRLTRSEPVVVEGPFRVASDQPDAA